MSNAPLDLAPWADRIRDLAVFRSTGLAGDLERLRDNPGAVPGAWVLPAEDSATAPASEPLIHQRVRSRISVIIGLSAYGSARMERVVDELTPLRAALWGSLIGWTPPGAAASVHFVGGRRLGPAGAAMWWEEIFETAVSVRK